MCTSSTARWRSARSTSPARWPASCCAASASTIRRDSCSTSTPTSPGIPCHVLRLSFTGEASFELHHPSTHSVELWQALMAAGRDLGVRPHGLQALFALRLEKGHVIVGMDTEMDSTPRRLNMDWAVKLDKPDVHRPHRAVAHRGPRRSPPAVRAHDGRAGAGRRRADLGRRRDRRSRHVELPVTRPRHDGDARLAEAHAVRRHRDHRRPRGTRSPTPRSTTRRVPVRAPEPLHGLRVVAKPAAIDAAVLPDGATLLRIAPDDAIVTGCRQRSPSTIAFAIVEPEYAFVHWRLTPARVRRRRAPHRVAAARQRANSAKA